MNNEEILTDEEIIEEFVIEAYELLANAEEDILELEVNTEKETVNRIFRAFHTVKGNAAMMGIDNISSLAHHAEDILTKIRSGKLTAGKKMVDLLLKVVDTLKQLLEDAKSGVTSATEAPRLIAELQKTGQVTGEAEAAPEPSGPGPLRILAAEDDFTSRKIIKLMLSKYGNVDVAVNGEEAVDAVKLSFAGADPQPYDLICTDIMMPELDGMEAAKKIRKIEKENGVSLNNEAVIIMTTALDDPKTVIKSLYKCGATAYLVKPIEKKSLDKELKKQGLI